MKAAASENEKVNAKRFRRTADDLLHLHKKVLKYPLVQHQKYHITFKKVTAFVGMFCQGKNSTFSDIHTGEKSA